MRRKVIGFALTALLHALCSPIAAQQPTKIPRIGYLSTTGSSKNPGPQIDAFRQGLRDLGYVERHNILVEYRYVEGKSDAIPSLVSELVQLKVDVLVFGPQPAIRAAKQATKTIPIVLKIPSQRGLSIVWRPGGNITGLTRLTRELSGKRLELLKEAVPGISRVGALLDAGQTENDFKPYLAPAGALKIQLQLIRVREPNPDFETAFQTAAKERASALITVSGSLFNRHIKRFADLAIKNRLPSMHETGQYVEAGGLMSYSAEDADNYRRAATYVDKILKGRKPADLPVEQPTKFEFVINLTTAKLIGLMCWRGRIRLSSDGSAMAEPDTKSEDRMNRLKSAILFVVLTVLTGCSAQLERPKEEDANRSKQNEEQRPPSVPTFTYRPGAGLMIEGR